MKLCSLVSYIINKLKEINEPTYDTGFVTYQQKVKIASL